MPRGEGSELLVAVVLAAIGGYVDVICVIRYSTFVATMTGNLVITGQTFYEVIGQSRRPILGHVDLRREEALYLVAFRSAIMLCNCFGAFCYCCFERRVAEHTARRAAPALALCTLLADVLPWLIGGEHAIDSANLKFGYSQWSVCFLAFSLGASHYLCSPSSEGSRLKAASTAPRPPRFPGCLLSLSPRLSPWRRRATCTRSRSSSSASASEKRSARRRGRACGSRAASCAAWRPGPCSARRRSTSTRLEQRRTRGCSRRSPSSSSGRCCCTTPSSSPRAAGRPHSESLCTPAARRRRSPRKPRARWPRVPVRRRRLLRELKCRCGVFAGV
mmetsp:Transcript_33648/g.108158  ORF Transcript_33648/g.108158 Transcript_33648/m.108158 type:complete len:332 (-) Transcript_33648:106-1101(-)